ncbi:cysQ protein [Candidatus Blochmanniella floridana]|uniref:3'(2'),5'-bisphosphate nucleotidase CysQ n=1 Tax=Blochmanniella floridana TaxID=203907 RepID=Q7VQN6_BLOFL|nr:cysQ protein [Candidatus Blochmannia floridanus]
MIVDQIIYIARIAGMEIMRIYTGFGHRKIYVQQKMDQSPVTNADLIAHQVIVYLLRNLTPNIPIISEECIPEWRDCRHWNNFWLIDPLDGTKEFLSRNGEFTVNIAFIQNGEPTIGVVYVPVYDVLYVANYGQAWKINSIGKQELLNITDYTYMSRYKNPLVVMSRTCISEYDQKLLNDYLMQIKNYKIVNIGSSFKFCLVAEGIAHFYPRFSSTKIWDTAAGHAIAKAAGALVNDWNGYPLNYSSINKYFLNPGFQVSLCS